MKSTVTSYNHNKNPSPSVSKRNPMALPIVLLRDKNQNLTHEQCLKAAFLHLRDLTEASLSDEWDNIWQSPWDEWKEGKFRKIVKRANPQRFAGLAQEQDAIHSKFLIDGELVELLSFPPYHLNKQDPRVRPLQVAGLNYDPTPAVSTDLSDTELILAYNSELGATTGKMMAQAAHAAQVLVRDYPELTKTSLQIVDNFDQENVDWLVTIVDSGFTEIAPNSTTVKIGQRKK